jgi:23S rRNA (adenine2503-C2)-methyltransferase
LIFTGEDVTFRKYQIAMNASGTNTLSLTLQELRNCLYESGFEKYRADQIFRWLYSHHARSFSEMTNIAKTDRERLASAFTIVPPRIDGTEVSYDGTRKFLFRLEDGHSVESVLIPDENRLTLCISSQVGCRQACGFCLTGSRGFSRDLRFFEITGQVMEIARLLHGEGSGRITNIVFMGMGEPLANLEEVVKALTLITGDAGLGFSPRRVTVSTSGLVPEIERLGASGARVNLAVSLNAATDDVRTRIMPVNRRYPIRELLGACKRFPLEPRRRITFEYVLLRGVNDSEEDARMLARLLKGIRCKVNLIPFNPFSGSGYERPEDAVIRRFQHILLDNRYTAPVRESRGRDISAACGQLREKAAPEGGSLTKERPVH